MTFIARILRYIFWVLVVSWVASWLRRAVTRMGEGAEKHEPNVDVPSVDIPSDAVTRKLVKDPVCGMHLTESLAIPLRESGQLVHFCSMECRDKYASGTQKFAANG